MWITFLSFECKCFTIFKSVNVMVRSPFPMTNIGKTKPSEEEHMRKRRKASATTPTTNPTRPMISKATGG